jgi:hypothetical protein
VNKPYPWAKSIMLSRAAAPEVYEHESVLKNVLEDLRIALGEHLEGGKWDVVIPYMLFCVLESFDNETSIAAVLGYLKHVAEGDLQHDMVRESLKGLELPKEPT